MQYLGKIAHIEIKLHWGLVISTTYNEYTRYKYFA